MLTSVLLLSRLIGLRVLAADGRRVGRLADLSVRLPAEPPIAERLVVRRRGAAAVLIPGSEAVIHGRAVVLASAVAELSGYVVDDVSAALEPEEILLRRDVLDTQIVDVVGHRLARVADVLLARGPGGRLQTVGVEVGFSGVLRRLGIGGRRIGQDVVAWSDLHLTSARGHQVQLAIPRAAVHRLDARSLAALVSRVGTHAASEILAAEDPGTAAAAVGSADPEVAEPALRAMSAPQAERIVAAMPAERAGRWRQRLSAQRRHGRRFLRSPVWARGHLNWPRR